VRQTVELKVFSIDGAVDMLTCGKPDGLSGLGSVGIHDGCMCGHQRWHPLFLSGALPKEEPKAGAHRLNQLESGRSLLLLPNMKNTRRSTYLALEATIRCGQQEGLQWAGSCLNLQVQHSTLWAAGSTDRRNTLCELLCWGLVLQGLSRSLVELSGNCAELCL
jgi:hypothetical protein